MATTTSTDEAFAEHDKLGPLGGKQAVLDNDTELRQVMISEFAAAAAAAREAAGQVERGAAGAVHAYRKALRRARAVLALVARSLPKSERRAVRRALAEARRALGSARDHTVAPETLSHMPLGEVERATAKAIVDAAGEAMPPVAEIKQLLAEGAARAAAQVEALEAALPPAISWDDLERGVRGVYDEARRARKAGKRSKRAFHTWRRRSKELTYQLELIAGYAGPHVAELHREIEGATDPQSPAVDLIMLRDFVRTYGQGVDSEAHDFLIAAIDGQLDDLTKAARRAGKDAFRRKPRAFVRRLRKAVKRDREPIAVDDNAS
ncbi:MAG: CHAD domain-containing protein [Acidobacteriota bacterium]